MNNWRKEEEEKKERKSEKQGLMRERSFGFAITLVLFCCATKQFYCWLLIYFFSFLDVFSEKHRGRFSLRLKSLKMGLGYTALGL